jgi:sterol desaturase/sphingolipid hydroxylase (fatty acid hydroxylase superfamily)
VAPRARVEGRPDRRPAGHAKRYLVDLHHVVERDKYMSKTHVATAGGFVLSAVLAILVHGFGLHSRILGYALLLATVMMFVGAMFVFLRRLNPPSRLSKGPWMRLPKSLLAFSASFFIATLPVAGILPKASVAGCWRRCSASACCGACPSCSSA